ncbi:sialic acid-binding Ig-like lectin 10 [Archocentrus centrarchus]|uniref:sialic acid-binding Ig-like lectin 10 n=1 Tax=Archocentrus centrarchus TaxID=63155 RepID=UPI0011E9E776|nr:sialic acid-binding Ig-like lectin 10 [Archocentrus centrarchus]
MFVLIWAALLFSVRGSNAGTGSSASEHCDREYCVTLSEQELRAEAGLCVVIPCFFRTAADFTPKHIVWFKCEASTERCGDADIIFHSNKNTKKKPQAGFEGRVSLLEPDVSQNNCSIIINDLKQSDSGSYQLRVNGEWNGQQDRFTFLTKAAVSVTGLIQKPTVTIPTLTEGQQATLTCTAPGLCSGSVPEITWTWRGAGGTESHITENITAFKTENLTAFTQRHTSTLTFNASAEHHNSEITCKIGFTGETTTEETSALRVNYVKEVKITGVTRVREGEALNLTCSVESFPPSLIMWKNHSSNTDHSDTGSSTLVISNVTAEHSGQYVCTAKYMNNTLKDEVNITVIYKRKPQIIGNTTVKEGDVLNLTCSVKSFPPALIVWKNHSSNTDHSDTGSSTLVIHNVTAEHSGLYVCTAKHLDTTVTSYVEVIVTWFSKILDGSGCVRQSEVLTCVCISEGFPLPTINWPLLKNHTEYSVITTVTNHTVNSTVSLSVRNHGNSTVECVSNNGNGEERENLIQKNLSGIAEQSSGFSLGYLKIIIAFLTGVLLSAIICLAKNYCSRKKRTSSQNSDQTSEMETRRDDQLVYYGQALRDHLTLNSNSGPTGVVYANINLSLLKRNPGREATRRQESTKTEYAEIKKALKEEQENDAVEEEEISCAKEEKLMVELEMKQCEPENKEGGDEAVYATVNDITDEI